MKFEVGNLVTYIVDPLIDFKGCEYRLFQTLQMAERDTGSIWEPRIDILKVRITIEELKSE